MRTKNPNAVEGQPCLRGDILLKNAAQLNKLVAVGPYAVTSPAFINGSKKFAIDNIPVGDVPRDIIQIQRPFDVGFPNIFLRTLTNGTWSAWTDYSTYIEGLALPVAEAAVDARFAEMLMLRNITTKTITGAVASSIIPASVAGTNVIPAGAWTELGSRVCVKAQALLTTGTSTTGKLDIVIDGTTLEGTALTLPNSLTAMALNIEIELTLVTATTVRVTGLSILQTVQGTAAPFMRGIASPADVTIDPEAALAIDGLYTFGGGEGGSLTVRELTITKQ